ncbi:MAG TPA: hypothetical protein EYH59_01290 [Pyrodictium sp.]|nr:hypothetical protein [Pyrodictium sp.]
METSIYGYIDNNTIILEVYVESETTLYVPDNCKVLEKKNTRLKAKCTVSLQDPTYMPPAYYLLPLPRDTPYLKQQTRIVLDIPPFWHAIGLVEYHSTVITKTKRVYMEGKQPPQILLYRRDPTTETLELHDILFDYPILLNNREDLRKCLYHIKYSALSYNDTAKGFSCCLDRTCELYCSRLAYSQIANTIASINLDNFNHYTIIAIIQRLLGCTLSAKAIKMIRNDLLAHRKTITNLLDLISVKVEEKIATINPLYPFKRLCIRYDCTSFEKEICYFDHNIVKVDLNTSCNTYISFICKSCWQELRHWLTRFSNNNT